MDRLPSLLRVLDALHTRVERVVNRVIDGVVDRGSTIHQRWK